MPIPFNKAAYLSSAQLQRVQSRRKCCCHREPSLKGLRLLLFRGSGESETTRNSWVGWRTQEGFDQGKTNCYNDVGLVSLEIRDSEGTYVVYELREEYRGKTMLEIASLKADELARGNTGTDAWTNGLLTIGDRVDSKIAVGVNLGDGRTDFSNVLRLGVGDGTKSDRPDWSFLFPLDGNCKGDFATGGLCFNIGGEERLTNHKFNGDSYDNIMELWGTAA